jgi:pumilio family protein 6
LNIEARNEQKSTRFERKSHDKSFEMITNAKRVWEQLRRGDISRDEQKDLMAKMMNIIGGRVQDVRLVAPIDNMLLTFWFM